MRFGVNYTPRTGWFHSWLDLDEGRVREDMAAIRGIGADHVRIFPLWPVLQPNRTMISSRAIEDVLTVVDAAGAAGLDVSVDALQGHLSSFEFMPSWVTTWHQRSLFTAPDVVAAETRLVAALARELRSRPHAAGIGLGNELPQFASTYYPIPDPFTSEQAGEWLDALLGAAEEAWPDGTHSFSYDDGVWFDDAQPFTPESAARAGDVTTVHSWVFGGVAQRYGEGHPALPLFPRYLVELAAAWGRRVGRERPIWLQEVGAPVPWVPAQAAPDFVTSVFENLRTAPHLDAITWWCSHDVSRELADFPELEYSLGLIDSRGEVKPEGAAFRDAVAAWDASPIAPSDTPAAVDPLILPSADPARRSEAGTRGDFFDGWQQRAAAGDIRALEVPTAV